MDRYSCSARRKRLLLRRTKGILALVLLGVLLVLLVMAGVAAVRDMVNAPAVNTGSKLESGTLAGAANTISTQGTAENTLPENAKGVIVVDAGHGYDDEGTDSGYLQGCCEKDINLQIALLLQEQLTQRGYEVRMIRDSDMPPVSMRPNSNGRYTITPQQRVSIANKSGADLYISIHCNSYEADESVSGTRLYCYENAPEGTQRFLTLLQQAVETAFNTGVNVYTQSLDMAYYVNKQTIMPSVLVEVGFVTNRQDAQKMQDTVYRQQFADALANGVDAYFG